LLTFSPLLACAFSNTSPLIAWSSHSSNLIDGLPLDSKNSNILETILNNDFVCGHEAVVLVHQPGLHASDLSQLSKGSHIARSLSSASSSRQYAYTPASVSDEEPLEIAQSISQKCQARLVNMMAGQGGVELFSDEKSVVVVSMPGLAMITEGSQRKTTMAEHDSLLATTLDSLPFSNHVIIYTGSAHGHSKRQEDLSTPDRPVLDLTTASTSASSPSIAVAKNRGGILHHYQLLTPGLIMVLLVVLFIFLPVLYFGISALASIQSPLRIDVMPKGYNASERKNQ